MNKLNRGVDVDEIGGLTKLIKQLSRIFHIYAKPIAIKLKIMNIGTNYLYWHKPQLANSNWQSRKKVPALPERVS